MKRVFSPTPTDEPEPNTGDSTPTPSSELDDDRFEVRKIASTQMVIATSPTLEVRRDRRTWTNRPYQTFESINAQPEFVGEEIGEEEFERVWTEAGRWFDVP
jgi:hypothetical protein